MSNLHNSHVIHTDNNYKVMKNGEKVKFFDLKNLRFVELEVATLIKLNPRIFSSYIKLSKSKDENKKPSDIRNKNGNLFIIDRVDNALFNFLTKEINKGTTSEFINTLLTMPQNEILWEDFLGE